MSRKQLYLSVLHEENGWMAINKRSGLIVERNPFESPTVEELVHQHLSRTSQKPYVGVVHRLDRVTSGVMIFAKKKSILRKLNEQFAQKKIQKTYLAVTTQSPDNTKGQLRHWLYKNQKEKRADIFHQAGKDRKEVVLNYRLIGNTEGKVLLEIAPLTGKFHQIRAQLSAVQCPIVGDSKYGSHEAYRPMAIGLHAWKLEFSDPLSGEPLLIEAPLPNDDLWNDFSLP